MRHYCRDAPVPQHIYGHVDERILYGMDESKSGFEECSIFGVISIPSRVLHFSIMCRSGACWWNIPIHMLFHTKPIEGAKRWDCNELQLWDCHGWDFTVLQYEYLREMGCQYRNREGILVPASYWFTLDHTENGWSLEPQEHKCYHVLLLEDGSGQIAAMPNNRILWKDDSFVKPGHPLDYKVMAKVTWHAETSRRNAQETAFTQDVDDDKVLSSSGQKPNQAGV